MKRYWFNLAIKAAKGSNCEKYKLGAVVMRGGAVISVGCNRMYPGHNGSIHAEVSALKRNLDLKGATLFVVRVLKNGEIACSKPCVECEDAIVRSGLKNIWYVDTGGYWTQKSIEELDA